MFEYSVEIHKGHCVDNNDLPDSLRVRLYLSKIRSETTLLLDVFIYGPI